MTLTPIALHAGAHHDPADRTAFEIGWDHAHHRLVPPVEHLHAGHPVRQGWEAGCAVFGVRTLRATPHVRKWLQLRLNAWLRGKAFDALHVTPLFLRRIEVAACPVTGVTLTHGTGADSDASVDRVNNDAGYAVGNLAVMSVRANAAKSMYGWRDAAQFARQVEAGQLGDIDGLDARQWARLAVLASFATPLSHAEAAALPLLVLPPPRLRVLNPAQALQVVLTLRFTRPGRAPRLDQVTRLFPEPLRPLVCSFMTTLLARRLAGGACPDAAALRAAMEGAWADALVLRRWQRLALQLTAAQCERIVAHAVRCAVAPPELRCLDLEAATDGWALDSGGLVATASPPARTAPARRSTAPAGRGRPRPVPAAVPMQVPLALEAGA